MTAILTVHVLAGVVALLAGLGAIATRKGGRTHRRAGKLYVAGMAVVVTTAVPLAIRIESWFLFAIAVFSGYLVFGGYRVILRRRTGIDGAGTVDWVGHGSMLVAGVGMILGGGWGTATGGIDLGPVLMVFGVIGGSFAVQSLREVRSPSNTGTPWFETHVAFMGGAYIATVTATVTVNLTMLPPVARWLGPTVVGAPLIALAVRRYRPRFDPNQAIE